MYTVRLVFQTRYAQECFLNFIEHVIWLRERLNDGVGWPLRRDINRELTESLRRLVESAALDRVSEIAGDSV